MCWLPVSQRNRVTSSLIARVTRCRVSSCTSPALGSCCDTTILAVTSHSRTVRVCRPFNKKSWNIRESQAIRLNKAPKPCTAFNIKFRQLQKPKIHFHKIIHVQHTLQDKAGNMFPLFQPSSDLFMRTLNGKGKGKVHPITGHEGPDGSRGIALLFL